MKRDLPPSSFLLHYRDETDKWKRLLFDSRDELVYLKSRLAEMISTSNDQDFLQTAEGFQEEFLTQDYVVDYLSAEVRRQGKRIESIEVLTVDKLSEIEEAQRKLRVEMRKADELFASVKQRFLEMTNESFTS